MAMRKRIVRLLTLNLPLLIFLLVTLFPFYWILVTSFKPESTILQRTIEYWPRAFTLDNYRMMLSDGGFDRYFANSLFASLTTTALVMAMASLGGYALARYRYKGKGVTMAILLLTQMLPGVVILVPLFEIFNKLRLINNLFSLTITYTTINLPFCMITMSGFFASIPPTLEEAARIDGCTMVGAIVRVVLPTILPGLIATGAFDFVNGWNEFVFTLNFITDSKMFTLPIGLSMMKGEFTVNYGGLAAGCIIALIPVLALFAYIQKYLVSGLAAGAVKG
jgi:multiple sugar transport system permease protein